MDKNRDQQFSLFELDLDPVVEEQKSAITPSGRYSNFVVYVDESGDHGMQNVDPNYPLFVLAFCVFYKKHYSEKVVPALEKFKFNNFGHDIVILYEREIRKETGPFKFVNEREKLVFIDRLSDIIEHSNFILISCVIDKQKLGGRVEHDNPYHLALGFCLETLHELLIEKNPVEKKTHVVFECRGKRRTRILNSNSVGSATGRTGWEFSSRSTLSSPTSGLIHRDCNLPISSRGRSASAY